jgi:hypothetical protein
MYHGCDPSYAQSTVEVASDHMKNGLKSKMKINHFTDLETDRKKREIEMYN